MKKLFAILLLTVILFNLTGCNKNAENKGENSSQNKVTTDINIESINTDFTDNDLNSDYDISTAVKTDKNADVITISDGKTYIVTDIHKQIIVSASQNDKPRIILENATINSENGPAIFIKSADKVFITVPANTESSITDGEKYDTSYDNADGAIFSKADTAINGSGKLNITGKYKCGIVSKDDLIISDTEIKIKSNGSAIEGKDCVKLTGTNITVEAETDGIKSTNTEDSNLGFVYIKSGEFTIKAQNDGIQAETALIIDGGNFNITTGSGSAVASTDSKNNGWGMWGKPDKNNNTDSTDTESAKAIKCSTLIKINNGDFIIDSSDDSIHSNSDTEINGGNISASSGDDGIHADDQLIINGGNIKVTKSYEGIEATAITVAGGTLDITASDDGFNAAGGNDSSAMGGRPGQNPFESDSDATIEINGGYILVNASGDGVDSNGNINISGGILLVSGPTNNGNGSLDFGGEAKINGGTAIFTGSSGMAQTFSESSEQASVAYALSSSQSGGTGISVVDNNGNVLASFTPVKDYNHIIISSKNLKKGKKYTISVGGNITETDQNGYTEAGKITDAAESFEIEITSIATSYGSVGMGGHGGMGGGPGGMGGRPDGMDGFGGKKPR